MADQKDPGTVFISYSHQDKAALELLQTFLRPFVRSGAVPLWDDTQIRPGDDWKRGIEQALSAAKEAIPCSVSHRAFTSEANQVSVEVRLMEIIQAKCYFMISLREKRAAMGRWTCPWSA
jgi:hypothetical protein